jgi:hypothetical protein
LESKNGIRKPRNWFYISRFASRKKPQSIKARHQSSSFVAVVTAVLHNRHWWQSSGVLRLAARP